MYEYFRIGTKSVRILEINSLHILSINRWSLEMSYLRVVVVGL